MSEFVKRKARTIFRRCDINQDGFLTRQDVDLMSVREFEGRQLNSEKKEKIVEDYAKIFESLYAIGGKDGKITEQDWVEAFQKLRVGAEFPKVIRNAIETAFDLMDSDGNGYVDEKEYSRFLYAVLRQDHEEHAKLAFAALDTNGDGLVSFDEFRDGILDFWFSEDETSPGTTIWGPLVDE